MPPHFALAGLLAALAVGAGCCALAPKGIGGLTNVLIVTVLMWPRLYELAIPPRFALAVLLALGAVSAAMTISVPASARTLVAVLVLGFTGITLVAFLGFQVVTGAMGDAYFRYFAIAPLSAAYGYLLVRSGRVSQMGHALLAVAVVTSLLAVAEVVTDGPILPGNPFDEFIDGQFRAAVFSEQTLVLSASLLCALTVAMVATRGALRVLAIAVLFAGIAATFSRGSAILAASYLIVAMVWAGAPGIRRYGALIAAAAAGLLLVVGPLYFLWRPASVSGVTSSDPTVASAQYRGAIYAMMPDSLKSHPLGWGMLGPPSGEYTLRSPFGTLDVSATVDSEVVHTALDFGYLGLALLAVILIVVIRRLRADRWWSQMAVLITAAGLYLSIHSWLCLLSLWAIALGAAVANPPSRSRTEEPDSDSSSSLITRQTLLQV
jgi:O-antigen ligase/polysaccharide polymerase Wzy-like membrane protein